MNGDVCRPLEMGLANKDLEGGATRLPLILFCVFVVVCWLVRVRRIIYSLMMDMVRLFVVFLYLCCRNAYVLCG